MESKGRKLSLTIVRKDDNKKDEHQKTDQKEQTNKENDSEGGRIALWPRSSDPKFQEPIYLKGTGDEAEQSGVQIVGVVVADYGKRERPPITFHSQGRR